MLATRLAGRPVAPAGRDAQPSMANVRHPAAAVERTRLGRTDPAITGLIGVGRPYRRRGLARSLLAKAFGVLHDRGKAEIELIRARPGGSA